MSPLAANEWAFVNGQPVVDIQILTTPITSLTCPVYTGPRYALLLSQTRAHLLKFRPTFSPRKIVLLDGSVLYTRRGILRVRCLSRDWDVVAEILDATSHGARGDYVTLDAAVGADFFQHHTLSIDHVSQTLRLDPSP